MVYMCTLLYGCAYVYLYIHIRVHMYVYMLHACVYSVYMSVCLAVRGGHKEFYHYFIPLREGLSLSTELSRQSANARDHSVFILCLQHWSYRSVQDHSQFLNRFEPRTACCVECTLFHRDISWSYIFFFKIIWSIVRNYLNM